MFKERGSCILISAMFPTEHIWTGCITGEGTTRVLHLILIMFKESLPLLRDVSLISCNESGTIQSYELDLPIERVEWHLKSYLKRSYFVSHNWSDYSNIQDCFKYCRLAPQTNMGLLSVFCPHSHAFRETSQKVPIQ